MRATLFAVFEDTDHAERAAGALLDHGLAPEDVSLLVQKDVETIEKERYHWENDVPEEGQVYTLYGYALVDNAGKRIEKNEFPVASPTNMPYGETLQRGVAMEETDSATHHAFREDSTAPTPPGDTDLEIEHHEHRTVEDRTDVHAKTGLSTTTAADAGAGAVKGATAGLAAGIAAALAAVFIPGFGLVLGGGAMALAAAGTAAATGAGAVAGAVTGYLKDQGVPEEMVTVYHEALGAGDAVLAVNVPADFERAEIEAVLAKYGAENIEMYGEVRTV